MILNKNNNIFSYNLQIKIVYDSIIKDWDILLFDFKKNSFDFIVVIL